MNTDFTIENLVIVAKKIAAKYNISMDSAMDIAEFNLQFSSLKDVLARI